MRLGLDPLATASVYDETKQDPGRTLLTCISGGKYVARFLAEGKGLDAGFTAHPSAVLAEEWGGITKPISVAFGELDVTMTPENRSTIESIFIAGNKTFQTSLYADAEHGFAVRTNLTDKKKAFAQESAYFQAVRWLDAWAKEE